MKIIGLSCFYHDSSACLIDNNVVIAAAAEERFSRIKHDNAFPYQALNYCVNEARVALNEVDCIVFYEKPIWKFERVLSQYLDSFPKGHQLFFQSAGNWLTQKLNITKVLREELHYYGEIQYVPHHLSHAASSYYLSPFTSATIVTLDGVGEWATTTISQGKGSTISMKKEIVFPHSLGLLYSTLTAFLGFKVNSDEYKVMGLAAYGNPATYRSHFQKIISLNPDGSYSLDMKYFDYTWSGHMPSPELARLFKMTPRVPKSKVFKKHQDLAAALQEALETAVFHLLNYAYREFKNPNLCLAGGVALNSSMNGKILSQTPFKRLFIPPDPGDGGGAMGAALYSYITQAPTSKKIKFNPYLGPSYAWYEIKRILDTFPVSYTFIEDRQLFLNKVVALLKKNHIIAWFQGRMEWGPRALGSRSILANARQAKMQALINKTIKKREEFRPFAPVILEEKVKDYFVTDQPLPESAKYMLFVYPFTEIGKKKVPATVHVDGTGRLQTVRRQDNPLYYDLIKTYYESTGVAALINTSFNIQEPIVCTPTDALTTFINSDIDYLIIDHYIVKKKT